MSSDNRKLTQAPTAEDIADAYHVYRSSHAAYLRMLRHHTRVVPVQDDVLFMAAQDELPVMRVLHAVAVGDGWNRMIARVCSRAEVAEAQLQGLIVRRDEQDGFSITDQGAEKLRRWTDQVVPLKDHHPRYTELWNAVANLEG